MSIAEVMGSFREFIRNLAAFFVLSTVLLRLLPEEAWVRYLRLFLGLLLVVYLLTPVASALSEETLFSDAFALCTSFFADEFSGLDNAAGGGMSGSSDAATARELEESIAAASAGEWEAILAACQTDIMELINDQIAEFGVRVVEIFAENTGTGEETLTFVLEETENTAAGETEETENTAAGETEETENVAAGETEESENAAAEESENTVNGTESALNGAENAASGTVTIEIPVISVFAGAQETDTDTGTEIEIDVTTLVKSKIAEYCSIDEGALKVVMK